MADVIYKKGQSSNLNNVQIKEGQILVTEDTGEMYIDVTDNDRKKINGMSNSKLGSAILIDDISPVTHEMGVKVRSKNLIPYPYYNFPLEQNGVTATLGNDGSITLNGTATENVAFKIYDNTNDTKRDFVVKSGVEYTVSGSPSGAASNTHYLRITPMNSRAYDFYDNSLTQRFNITEDTAVKWVFVVVKPGVTVNNLVFKPQLEEGTTATDYTPYVPDLTAVKVSRLGKNLFDNNKLSEWGLTLSDGKYAGSVGKLNSKTLFSSFKSNTRYTISVKASNASKSSATLLIDINYTDGTTQTVIRVSSTTESVYSFTSTANKSISNITSTYYDVDTINIAYIQIEEGTIATEYEPYKECAEYTPTADGTVSGVTSLYPNTTLMTDTDGVIIDCEYLTNNYKPVLDNRIPKQTQSDWQQNDETANDYVKNRPGGYIDNDTIVKIPEKYLDIKNTNIVNGSAEGSIRSINSKAEDDTYTIGTNAFAEGKGTKASGGNSHAEGTNTTASGYSSHAEGADTTASGNCSHAEGIDTTASETNAHAEGIKTTASGVGAHAEGIKTTASGHYSHAEGGGTIALGMYSHVQGRYNISNTTYADVIGNGRSDTERSNAYTMDWNGNAWYAGDVYVGSTSGKNKDEGSKKLATEEYIDKKIEVSDTAPIEEENKIWLKPITDSSEYIIEEGTNGIWTYRIWSSGISECWGKQSISVTTSTSNNGYYTGSVGSLQYPSNLFISEPVLNCTLKASSFPGHLFIDGTESSSYTGTISIAAHSNTTVNGYIHLSAKGRWK